MLEYLAKYYNLLMLCFTAVHPRGLRSQAKKLNAPRVDCGVGEDARRGVTLEASIFHGLKILRLLNFECKVMQL